MPEDSVSSAPARLPEITRTDAAAALVTSHYVGTPERQRALADTTIAEWRGSPPPDGFLSLTCFLSGDGETVLAYAQWTSVETHRRFAAAAPSPAGIDLRDPVRYRLYRSAAEGGGDQPPGCVITATFDVDGPERQRYITDALLDAAARIGPLPGALSSHFHHSLDGSRVLNYAEWSDLDAHDAAADNADLDEVYRISSETPGVRPTRGRMYLPHAHLIR